MKKWILGIFSGLLVTVGGGLLLKSLTEQSKSRGGQTVAQKETIHFNDIQNKTFKEKIYTFPNGKKNPTTVWAYLDLDDGLHGRERCDLMIQVPFFSEKKGFYMRSWNSDIKLALNGRCSNIPQNSQGSKEMRLYLNREYCLTTSKGRTATIVFHQILTSWGSHASINVRMKIKSYDAL